MGKHIHVVEQKQNRNYHLNWRRTKLFNCSFVRLEAVLQEWELRCRGCRKLMRVISIRCLAVLKKAVPLQKQNPTQPVAHAKKGKDGICWFISHEANSSNSWTVSIRLIMAEIRYLLQVEFRRRKPRDTPLNGDGKNLRKFLDNWEFYCTFAQWMKSP